MTSINRTRSVCINILRVERRNFILLSYYRSLHWILPLHLNWMVPLIKGISDRGTITRTDTNDIPSVSRYLFNWFFFQRITFIMEMHIEVEWLLTLQYSIISTIRSENQTEDRLNLKKKEVTTYPNVDDKAISGQFYIWSSVWCVFGNNEIYSWLNRTRRDLRNRKQLPWSQEPLAVSQLEAETLFGSRARE